MREPRFCEARVCACFGWYLSEARYLRHAALLSLQTARASCSRALLQPRSGFPSITFSVFFKSNSPNVAVCSFSKIHHVAEQLWNPTGVVPPCVSPPLLPSLTRGSSPPLPPVSSGLRPRSGQRGSSSSGSRSSPPRCPLGGGGSPDLNPPSSHPPLQMESSPPRALCPPPSACSALP